MVEDRLRETAEDHADLREPVLEGGGDADGVDDGVDRDPGEDLPLLERDPELVVHLEELGIDLVERLRLVRHRLRRGVVADPLVVDFRVPDLRPGRLLHREPVAERLEAPLGEPDRLVLLRGDQADHVLRKTLRDDVGFDVRDETVLVLAARQLVEDFRVRTHLGLRAERPAGFGQVARSQRLEAICRFGKERGPVRSHFHCKPCAGRVNRGCRRR
jgi:hypothetical protein